MPLHMKRDRREYEIVQVQSIDKLLITEELQAFLCLPTADSRNQSLTNSRPIASRSQEKILVIFN